MATLAKVKRTTNRWDFLKIMMDSYLFDTLLQARYALGAACCGWRNWLLAMTKAPPKTTMSRLTIPGVGSLRVHWEGYNGKYAPQLKIIYTPTKKIKDQVKAHNARARKEWENERRAKHETGSMLKAKMAGQDNEDLCKTCTGTEELEEKRIHDHRSTLNSHFWKHSRYSSPARLRRKY